MGRLRKGHLHNLCGKPPSQCLTRRSQIPKPEGIRPCPSAVFSLGQKESMTCCGLTPPIYSSTLYASCDTGCPVTMKGYCQMFSYALPGSLWSRPIIPHMVATSVILSYPLNKASPWVLEGNPLPFKSHHNITDMMYCQFIIVSHLKARLWLPWW